MKANHGKPKEPSIFEVMLLATMIFAFTMWFSGCFSFIGGIIKSDILEAKIDVK